MSVSRILFIFSLVTVLPLSPSLHAEEKDNYCLSHREFITTLEYMRNQDHYEMGEKFSQETAHEVSKGCTGAAQRFVRVYELLVKVEAGARSSAQYAIELSKMTDAHVDAFMGVFKNAYEPKKLDLDVFSAMKIAHRLSSDYKGDVKQALSDYESLVEFCLDEKHIGAPAPQCAVLAADIATMGEEHSSPISQSFMKLYSWLRTHDQAGVSVSKAIEIAKNVVKTHPKAVDNFIAAYEYALKDKGLHYSANQSLAFAMDITHRAVATPLLDDQRLPASEKSR